uniref:NADH dehydrogenase subunit 6 n=1 Tax=Carpoglyphus lactis TaxID=223459 RepID=A0A7D4W7V0_CARLC|nr:NADH dehydrogenase subunit 6 [Carpoglyphus lactis]QKV10190.1 NADH dehydrogenase subunit 6 [Carpoglyphus lactis]
MMVLLISFVVMSVMLYSITPIKYTFSLTLSSLVVMIMSYEFCNSIFLSMAVVISFSSGMMILFSYCSVMTSYESKNKSSSASMLLYMLLGTLVLFLSPLSKNCLTGSVKMSMMASGLSLMFMMSLVILVMLMINKSLMSPKKSLLSSY